MECILTPQAMAITHREPLDIELARSNYKETILNYFPLKIKRHQSINEKIQDEYSHHHIKQ